MIQSKIKYFWLLLILAFVSSCNSPMYQIIEVEEPVEEVKKEPEPVSDVKEQTTEVKTETPSEPKYTEKEVVSRVYIIQIGAFNEERRAYSLMKRAQKKLVNEEIYYKDVDGLYKVRFGSFASKEAAINFLPVVQNAGYMDCFVVELTSLKVEKR
ncbi:MAG: SPOR domain-containing protein [Chlorobi bacterium]|nr:SPOR domain-containing protein [Chlorobiota bacterium]MCI0714824.1 SPOR domain-containing protein [Chlorobiota bacterium]